MENLRNIGRGQASLMAIIIAATTTIVGSAFTAWATANGSIADIRKDVSVVEERETNHYGEIQRQLSEINGKLDTALGIRKTTLK